ncbi:hypothetical protein K8S19_08365 [bacterium]|nr:hypothetical protein [bacterium]
MGTTKSGIEPTVAGALAYLLWFISGIFFYILEKDNPFVRFHALQSTMLFGGLFVIIMILKVIPVLGFILNFFLSIAAFSVWLFMMVKASQGIAFKLPVIGDIAERNI